MKADAGFRSGFVALVGRPNTGKSTLVNALVGEKVSITSPTPQTTRNRIAGIVNADGCQVVLLDLPGSQKPLDLLTEHMQAAVETTLAEVDLILLLLDASSETGPGDRYVARGAFSAGTPVMIVVNKVDLVTPAELLPRIDEAAALGDFQELFPVSALDGEGLDQLFAAIDATMPEGPRYFPEDMVTDQPEAVLVSELVREQVIRMTREEVPHAVAVEVLSMETREDSGLVHIEAAIFVEQKSQKGIIVGKQGRMIKQIGTQARREIQALLGSRVYLEMMVKVRKKWRNDERRLGELGL